MTGIVAAFAWIGGALTAVGTAVGVSGAMAAIVGGAIVGAAIGGITAAITGGDIGKGVLFGAIGGAVLGGVSGAIGGLGGTATSGLTATGNLANSGSVLSTFEGVTFVGPTVVEGGTAISVASATTPMIGAGGAAATEWGTGALLVAGGVEEAAKMYAAGEAQDAAIAEAQKVREWQAGQAALDRASAEARTATSAGASGSGALTVDDQSRLQLEKSEQMLTQSDRDALENIEAINQAAIDQLQQIDKTAGYNIAQSKQDAANQMGVDAASAGLQQEALDVKHATQAASVTGAGTQSRGEFVEGYEKAQGVLTKPTELVA